MSEREAVLFANEAFYRAFADRDMKAMREAWAREAAVICVHPGWPPVEGHEAVLASWQAILGSPGSPKIVCRAPSACYRGDMGFVVCYEEIEGQFLIATNVFVREAGRWRMVHHQAGPTSGAPPDESGGDRPTVN